VLKNAHNPNPSDADRKALAKVWRLTDKLEELGKCLPCTRADRLVFQDGFRKSIPDDGMLADSSSRGLVRTFSSRRIDKTSSGERDYVTEATRR
jgi:hypothetical protein